MVSLPRASSTGRPLATRQQLKMVATQPYRFMSRTSCVISSAVLKAVEAMV